MDEQGKAAVNVSNSIGRLIKGLTLRQESSNAFKLYILLAFPDNCFWICFIHLQNCLQTRV
jgi:hypothetical protein